MGGEGGFKKTQKREAALRRTYLVLLAWTSSFFFFYRSEEKANPHRPPIITVEPQHPPATPGVSAPSQLFRTPWSLQRCGITSSTAEYFRVRQAAWWLLLFVHVYGFFWRDSESQSSGCRPLVVCGGEQVKMSKFCAVKVCRLFLVWVKDVRAHTYFCYLDGFWIRTDLLCSYWFLLFLKYFFEGLQKIFWFSASFESRSAKIGFGASIWAILRNSMVLFCLKPVHISAALGADYWSSRIDPHRLHTSITASFCSTVWFCFTYWLNDRIREYRGVTLPPCLLLQERFLLDRPSLYHAAAANHVFQRSALTRTQPSAAWSNGRKHRRQKERTGEEDPVNEKFNCRAWWRLIGPSDGPLRISQYWPAADWSEHPLYELEILARGCLKPWRGISTIAVFYWCRKWQYLGYNRGKHDEGLHLVLFQCRKYMKTRLFGQTNHFFSLAINTTHR